MTQPKYLWTPPPVYSLPVRGKKESFPINRLFFVGRTYCRIRPKQSTENPCVGGSIPPLVTNIIQRLSEKSLQQEQVWPE